MKKFIIWFGLCLFLHTPFTVAQAFTQKQIPVLMYHNVLSDQENQRMRNSNIITDIELDRQMAYLSQNGFHVITLDQLERFLYDKIPLPKDSVVLTFDDGYLGNLTYAYPILKKYHMKAAIAVLPHLLQATNRKVPHEVQTFSSRQFRGKEDVFSLVSHTDELHEKKNGVALIKVLPENTVYQDLSHSQQFLQTHYLVYPYGAYDQRALRLVKQAGYKLAFGMNEGYVRQGDNPFRLHRIYIYRGMSMSEFAYKMKVN